MRNFISTVFLGLLLGVLATSATPTRADAHGLGGIDAQRTSTDVASVEPTPRSFTVRSIENGERVELTRTGANDVIVLGVDDEKYILISDQGTFENIKSATRLINNSVQSNFASEQAREAFHKTSDDPDTPPQWEKISSSQTYRWHDHRAHFMGTPPSQSGSLGTTTIPITVGDTRYIATFVMVAGSQGPWFAYIAFIGVVCIALMYLVMGRKDHAFKIFTPRVLAALAGGAALVEILHAYSYMKFAEFSMAEELSTSLYALVVIILMASSCVVLSMKSSGDTQSQWIKHAPLMCASGFVGIVAGFLLEYKVLVEPYLPTTLPVWFARLIVSYIAIVSVLLFTIGITHVTKQNISELNSSDHDSSPSM